MNSNPGAGDMGIPLKYEDNPSFRSMLGDCNVDCIPKSHDERGFIYYMNSMKSKINMNPTGSGSELNKYYTKAIEWASLSLEERFNHYVSPAIEHPFEMLKSKSSFMSNKLKNKINITNNNENNENNMQLFISHNIKLPLSIFVESNDAQVLRGVPGGMVPKRFKIGDEVEANMETWAAVRIVALEYSEPNNPNWPTNKIAAYQFKFLNGPDRGVLAFAPSDTPIFIRASHVIKKIWYNEWVKHTTPTLSKKQIEKVIKSINSIC